MAEVGGVRDRPTRRTPSTLRTAMFPCFFMSESPLDIFRRHLSRGGTQSTDAHEVIGHAGQAHQLHLAPDAPQARLAQAADSLAPTKELLDAFAHDLTGSIAGRVQSASIRAGRIVSRIDGDVRSNALCEQAIDKSTGVITVVAARP